MSATISPDAILKQLADLWTAEGKRGDAGVLRACSMTLVILAEAADDPSALGETVAALMPEHPARAILVRLSGDGERALAERVYEQCWMPFGQRRQICCEQIEITVSDAALADLPSVLLPLAVPDLPVILWCRSARLTGMPERRDIASIATKAIFDSAAVPDDPADALQRLSALRQTGLLVGDLAWTRLTRWRESLARFFENRDYLARLSAIRTVRVAFPIDLATSGWYLAAWAGNALGSLPSVEAGAPALRLDLSSPDFSVSLTREDDRLITTVDGKSTCASLSAPTAYLLMREELGIVRSDPVFDKTLASAARLAVHSSSEQ
ncbi:MAG TPA: glucose-6-phosphate dehydrogenase assembly protein OpcA [Candidatus Acidoferrales bacterium]|nr:glucose-6-phosphate dehydrogenase assembly protein OpcA [Candidatus Acidoferrales bacterium]